MTARGPEIDRSRSAARIEHDIEALAGSELTPSPDPDRDTAAR